MHGPDDDFPIDLSDFEYYAYRDEITENPMVMVFRTHIDGPVDVEAFRTSVAEAICHHPLLRSVIDQTGNRLSWKLLDGHEPQLDCTFHDDEYPPANCPGAWLDLTREAGARFELRICPHRSVLISWFHHACVDGIGGIGFLSDVFALYGQKTAASEADRPEVQWPVPQVLLKRGAIPDLGGHGGKKKKWTEWLRG
ncbi:MAG: hypothetical protein ABGZ24_11560, partial [Fuerstiella sp.]